MDFTGLLRCSRQGEGRGRCQPPNPERGAGLLPVAWAWFFCPTGSCSRQDLMPADDGVGGPPPRILPCHCRWSIRQLWPRNELPPTGAQAPEVRAPRAGHQRPAGWDRPWEAVGRRPWRWDWLGLRSRHPADSPGLFPPQQSRLFRAEKLQLPSRFFLFNSFIEAYFPLFSVGSSIISHKFRMVQSPPRLVVESKFMPTGGRALSQPGPGPPLTHLCLCSLTFPGPFRATHGLRCPASFPSCVVIVHHVSEHHSFKTPIVSHGTDISHFVCAFTVWTSGLFPVFSREESSCREYSRTSV